MSQDVALEGLTMRFGPLTAVDRVTLTIKAGEFFSFLGPSGCGKTTILRIVSGFTEPTAGRVLIGGRDMAGIGPNRRPTTLIFQNLALFPLMPVWENVAFALEVRGVAKAERRRRAEELLELVAMPEVVDKTVAELSGGQKQRVAVARALAVEPEVMLLDEPLSALDLKLRQHMRAELRAIQRRTGVTFIYITHDQGEALTMSDRIAVMSRGAIEQVGAPSEIYDDPATPFVATFVGENNAFPGRVAATDGALAEIETAHGRLRGRNPRGLATGDQAILFVRPEKLALDPADGANRVSARVDRTEFEGSFVNLFLRDAEGHELALQTTEHERVAALAAGAEARVGFLAQHATVLAHGELARD